MPEQAERLAWLAQTIPRLLGSGIVYTLTVRDANLVATWLRSRGISAEAYTSKSDHREPLEDALLANQVKALVATPALGMGFDKPDLAFVIHFQSPSSVVSYYQQVGRAGRALPTAYGVLLCGAEDDHITSFFIESAFPTRAEAAAVLSAIGDAPSGLSVPELLTQVNLSQARIQKTIDLLSLESPAPIVKNGSKWQLTVGSLSQSFWDRAERLTQLRIAEKAQMAEYARLRSGHMAYLIRALDGAAPAVEPARLVPLSEHVDPALVQDARAFLRRTDYPIEPRKKWPPRGLPRFGATGNIPEHERARPGRALCVWDDGGWGALVKAGKYTAERFDEALVQAAASLIRSWPRGTTLGWVTCVPSLRRPTLVPNFAQRLAAALGLPFYPVLQQIGDRAEQKLMANSSKQALNLDGTLAVTGTVPPTPVLLVDDVVDSRWTFAVSAWCLIRAGSGQVYPFALALAGGGE
ncbi:MAG TPA: helicase-related protein [Kofleriaceae bacterium]